MTDNKRVWLFREGNADMRDLLGGKGANLAEMTNAGLPVPPGLTITTETCMEYINNGNKMPEGLKPASGIRQIGRKTFNAGDDGNHFKLRFKR